MRTKTSLVELGEHHRGTVDDNVDQILIVFYWTFAIILIYLWVYWCQKGTVLTKNVVGLQSTVGEKCVTCTCKAIELLIRLFVMLMFAESHGQEWHLG